MMETKTFLGLTIKQWKRIFYVDWISVTIYTITILFLFQVAACFV